MGDVFSVGVSGLNAAQAGLSTTGQNISNVNTPGFSRQVVDQTTNTPLGTGSGFYGQGVQVSTIKRMYSDFMVAQLNQAQSQSSQYDTYLAEINQINNMLADPTAGLSPAIQGFFKGVQSVVANPQDLPSRQSMLSSAQSLVSVFQAQDQRLTDMKNGVNSQITSVVATINGLATQIASLNQAIAIASNSNNNQPPNDLLDQRDAAITNLNKQVGATVVKQGDGSYNVFIGSGQPLVLSGQAMTLAAAPNPSNPTSTTIGYSTNGGIAYLQESSITGGSLGGLLSYRSQTLDIAQNQLGRIALGFATTFNAQHQMGQDLNGNPGTAFFNVAPPVVYGNAANGAGSNVAVTVSNVGQLTSNNYLLQYNGLSGVWSMLNTSNNANVPLTASVPATAPPTFTADGMTIVATPPTSPSMNASFTIEPTVNGAKNIGVLITDTALIAAAAPIKTSPALNPNGSTSNLGNAVISSGAITNAANWNQAANNKNVSIKFAVDQSVSPPVTTYDIVDNGASPAPISLLTGQPSAPMANGRYPMTYTDGATINLSLNSAQAASIQTAQAAAAVPAKPGTGTAYLAAYNAALAVPLTAAQAQATALVVQNAANVAATTAGATATSIFAAAGSPATLAAATAAAGGSAVGAQAAINAAQNAIAATFSTATPASQLASATATVPAAPGTGSLYAAAYNAAVAAGAAAGVGGAADTAAKAIQAAGNAASLLAGATAGSILAAAAATVVTPGVTAAVSAAMIGAAQNAITSSFASTSPAVQLAAAAATVPATPSSGTVYTTAYNNLIAAGATVADAITSARAIQNAAYLASIAGGATATSVANASNSAATIASATTGTVTAGMAASAAAAAYGVIVAASSLSPTFDYGANFSISGTPAAGDSFTVKQNLGGTTDGRNAQLLSKLQTANTLAGNTASYEGAYAQFVSQIGNLARQIQVTGTAQTNLVNQVTQAQQAVSGVNLDEEAANLMRYQRAYQACGKMMQIAGTLFDSILALK